LTIDGDKQNSEFCIITECKSNDGNGGGIYAEVGDKSIFSVNATNIISCEAN
jgi:hypothetical protein